MEVIATKRIAILGAGVIGLATAHRLVELNRGAKSLDITILADRFNVATTSDGAGGLFRPDDRFMKGVPKELAKKWSTDSFKYFDKLLFGPNGGKSGAFQASGYQLFNEERHDPSYKDIIYQFRHLTEDELNQFPKKFNHGYFSTTICIDPRAHMKYLTDLLTNKGVKLVYKKLENLTNFLEEENYDVVFNCVGLDAKHLCNDANIRPIRGQMIRVKAPWIKHFYYTGDDCYIIPNIDTIALGGTRQIDNFSLALDKNDSLGILSRCKELCPSLENATIEWEWVGLRPHREPTRVEKEIFVGRNSKKKLLIHNYGHGGNGISLSRGTAVHAVELLLDSAKELTSELKSKL